MNATPGRSGRPNLLLLHCPAGGGHRAAAMAIAEAAEARGVSVRVEDALAWAPAWFRAAYVNLHLKSTEHVPELYGQSYEALNARSPFDGLRARVDGALASRLRQFVRESAPTAVIATHFFPLSVLGRERLRGRLASPLVGVVTDYTAHAMWAEPGVDLFCAPAAALAELARHAGRPGPARGRLAFRPTGIPVRAAFGRLPPLRLPEAGEPLSVLVTSGGFGVGPLLDVLRSFAHETSARGGRGTRRASPRVEITAICGDNPGRVAEATALASSLGLRATIVGFERDMPARLEAAHVVVGKPGGLTLSEALAAGRPFFSVGACPGQEACNEAFASSEGAAVRAEPHEVGRAISAALHGGALARMAARARAIAAPDAASRIVTAALAEARARGALAA